MISLLFSLLFNVSFAQQKVQIKTFSPQGYVKSVEQVRVQFNQPMVRFGDIKLDSPVLSSCFDPTKGQGRWIDSKNWVFDFNAALPGGQACEVKFNDQSFRFNTGGPHIKNIFPETYRDIEPDQNFVILIDSPVKDESLSAGVYFVVENIGDRFPAKVVRGGEAEKVFNAAKTEYQYEKEQFKGEYVVLKSERPFPAGSRVSLVWSKNVQSPAGFSSKEDETHEFNVRAPFKLSFNCDREAPNKPCVPLMGMRVNSSAPFSVKFAEKIYLLSPDGRRIKANNLESNSSQDHISYLEFKELFIANSEYTLVLPEKMKDEDGRLLSNQAQFPLKIRTGDNPSLLKFTSAFGVIEAGPDAAMAVTLRRVEKSVQTQFAGWTGKLQAAEFRSVIKALGQVIRNPYGEEPLKDWQGKNTQKIQVAKPAKASDLEVVGIPLKAPGFYVVEMKSPLLGQHLLDKKQPYFVRSAGLVTNLSVHIKHSSKEAWIWVTELKSGKIVPGAKITIFDNTGNAMGSATSDARGLSVLKFSKPVDEWPSASEGGFYGGFFAVAEKGDDFSFTHTSWDQGIESWRFQLRSAESHSPLLGHAILDRTLLKPEEKISAKIVLRKTNMTGFSLPGATEWPTRLTVTHDSGLQTFKLPLSWNKKTGVAQVTWDVPAGAKLGHWLLTLERDQPSLNISVGTVAVENFRVPLMQVRLDGAKPEFIQERNISVQVSGTYFSGGPTGELPVKMRWSVEPGYFAAQNDDFSEYTFANGAVSEGLFRQGEGEAQKHIPQSGAKDFALNKQGVAQESIAGIKYASVPQTLRTEVEYKDPNGEIQSISRTFSLWSSSLVLGMKSRGWSATQDRVEFDIVALDLQQRPLQNQSIQVDLYTRKTYTHRKRLVGGFYSYEDTYEYKKIGPLCKGATDKKGQFVCVGKSKVSGSVLAVVSGKDTQGRNSFANTNQWIVRSGEKQWFGSEDNDRADLIPFKKSYEPGETAEFQLRTTFPQAKVLVTVEREGILHSEIVDVSGESPVVRVPIKKEYAPNVVVSAFAIRGRLSEPKPTALVDLGKPAYKLGLSQIKVGWNENKLKVQVATDKKSYSARQVSKVTVSVKDSQGRPARKAEVALVAVDEGLLAIRDNDSWDLLSSMMRLRPHNVQTSTSLTQVVGRRHFGLKAIPIGGDGAGGLRRELFDTLLYWNPSVKLDANGEAKVDIKLNDSTTSFRIVAIALQGQDQFGTGWTAIQSSQDIMIMPGLSSVVREGEEFKAGFTVRNASSATQDLKLNLAVTPAIADLQAHSLRLEPGEAKEVFWKIKVPVNASELQYIMSARNSAGRVVDEVKKTQKILQLRIARIYQSEFGRWPELKSLKLQQPVGADFSKSSVVVEASSALGGSTEGIQEFWKNYVYSCLEQQVSKTVSLNDKSAWGKLEAKFATYLDENGLLKYFPGNAVSGSVNLTAYVLNIAHEAGFEFSEDHESRMLEALEAYVHGKLREPHELDRADSVMKKITALETLSRYRRLNPVADLAGIEFSPNQWPMYTLLEWHNIHQWEKNIKDREKVLTDIEAVLRSRFYFSAKRMQLKEENLEEMPWLMRDTESSVLRLILTMMKDPQWQNDLPRLYQGAWSLQKEGSWGLTATNAWGSLVMRKMQEHFGSEKVEGIFLAELSGVSKKFDWSKGRSGELSVPWTQSQGEIKFDQQGAGRPWITVSIKAATPVTKPTFAGFSMEKTITPLEQKHKGRWSIGDTALIQLKVKGKAPQTWVVVEDPVPTGASIVQASYATSVERKSELIRFYHSWFPQEEQVMEYTLRFNQAGTYLLPASRVEAMYSPDLFAELPESSWSVE